MKQATSTPLSRGHGCCLPAPQGLESARTWSKATTEAVGHWPGLRGSSVCTWLCVPVVTLSEGPPSGSAGLRPARDHPHRGNRVLPSPARRGHAATKHQGVGNLEGQTVVAHSGKGQQAWCWGWGRSYILPGRQPPPIEHARGTWPRVIVSVTVPPLLALRVPGAAPRSLCKWPCPHPTAALAGG